MRILLATDGSPRAEVAHQLVTSIEWPAGSTVRVVTVVEAGAAPHEDSWGPALAVNFEQLEADWRKRAESTLHGATASIEKAALTVEGRVLRGRPASAIVDEAVAWGASVIVMGSRGHGMIASMLLGSVTAEVVDRAPCPVLVARSPRLTRVVLAHDGSSFARAAEEVLTAWPIFSPTAIEVATVAHLASPWVSGLAPTVYAEAVEDYAESRSAILRVATDSCESACRRLRDAGLRASAVVTEGDAATAIMRVAQNHQADLIVLGTHGRTRLARLMLGSVARNVMLHADCSVLIVRRLAVEPRAEKQTEVDEAHYAGSSE